MIREKIKTKYGIISITEDENGAIEICYGTMENVLIEPKKANSIVFHTLKPRSNKVLTIKDISELEC